MAADALPRLRGAARSLQPGVAVVSLGRHFSQHRPTDDARIDRRGRHDFRHHCRADRPFGRVHARVVGHGGCARDGPCCELLAFGGARWPKHGGRGRAPQRGSDHATCHPLLPCHARNAQRRAGIGHDGDRHQAGHYHQRALFPHLRRRRSARPAVADRVDARGYCRWHAAAALQHLRPQDLRCRRQPDRCALFRHPDQARDDLGLCAGRRSCWTRGAHPVGSLARRASRRRPRNGAGRHCFRHSRRLQPVRRARVHPGHPARQPHHRHTEQRTGPTWRLLADAARHQGGDYRCGRRLHKTLDCFAAGSREARHRPPRNDDDFGGKARRMIMKVSLATKAALAAGVAVGTLAYASSALADAPASCVKGVDLATLGPTSIVGQGPHGEKAASPEVLKLSDAGAEKVKAGHFKVGISMQTVNLDWSQLQVQGITDTLKKYGVSVTGVASAEYQVDKQIADIENTIQQHPDGIISIPVDFTATAPTYKKVSQAGIKLVFMDSIPTGLKHPEEYAAMISADSQGNGQIAAQILASCVAQGGTIGLVNFGVDYFSTNERNKGDGGWMKKNRPDIKMKQVDFTDPAKVSQIAGDFLTANPDVKGVFAVWDQPALDTLSSMRAQGINIPVTTVDLGLQSAIEIAKGGPLKATGSQRPYDQGAAEAMAMMNALIGKTTPAWVGVQSLPVVQSNVLESFKTVFKKDPPTELTDACPPAKPNCN